MLGSSLRDIDSVYKAPYIAQRGGGQLIRYYQSGGGLGSILKSAIAYLMPLLKSSSKAIGQEAARSGLQIMQKIGNDNKTLKDLIADESSQAISNLAQRAKSKIENLKGGSIKTSKSKKNHFIQPFVIRGVKSQIIETKKKTKKNKKKVSKNQLKKSSKVTLKKRKSPKKKVKSQNKNVLFE